MRIRHWFSLAACLLLAGSHSLAQESADPFFRQVRKAVSDENIQELHLLARFDPWSFREVTNRLADLALNQTLEEDEEDVLGGYNRFLVAGLLPGRHFFLPICGTIVFIQVRKSSVSSIRFR